MSEKIPPSQSLIKPESTTKTMYQSDYLEIRKRFYEGPQGPRDWDYVARIGGMKAVGIFALVPKTVHGLDFDEVGVVLIRQFRPAVDAFTIEMPAGLLDKDGEDPEAAMIRELKEETGYLADKVEYLSEFYSSPGMSAESIIIYTADVTGLGEQELDVGEDIYVYPPVAVSKLGDFLAEETKKGMIVDYKIQAAWARMYWQGQFT